MWIRWWRISATHQSIVKLFLPLVVLTYVCWLNAEGVVTVFIGPVLVLSLRTVDFNIVIVYYFIGIELIFLNFWSSLMNNRRLNRKLSILIVIIQQELLCLATNLLRLLLLQMIVPLLLAIIDAVVSFLIDHIIIILLISSIVFFLMRLKLFIAIFSWGDSILNNQVDRLIIFVWVLVDILLLLCCHQQCLLHSQVFMRRLGSRGIYERWSPCQDIAEKSISVLSSWRWYHLLTAEVSHRSCSCNLVSARYCAWE